MARFVYDALNADGVKLSGGLDAQSEREAARALERRGLTVLTLEGAETAVRAAGGSRRRLRREDLILALHELATMLQSGVTLADAVLAQSQSAHHPRLLDAFESMATALRRGQSFSEALEAAGLPLPPYFLTVVRAGEQGGLLDQALADGVAQLEYDHKVRAEARQALTYPTILVLAGLGAIILMFTFVVPNFSSLLSRAEDLPFLAWAVIGTGTFAREHWVWLLSGAAASGVGVAWLLRSPERRSGFDQWLERLPVVGPWRVESETATWAAILATLLANRVPLMQALELAQTSVRSPGRRVRLEEASRAVRSGSMLADALEEQSTLTATGYNLVRVGERSGELPSMLRSLARLCEEAGRSRMKQFLSLLEPAAILVIGLVIGLVMIGIILAITSANEIAL